MTKQKKEEYRKINVKLCGIMLSDAVRLTICDPSPAGSERSRERSGWVTTLVRNGWEIDPERQLLDAYSLKSVDHVDDFVVWVDDTRSRYREDFKLRYPPPQSGEWDCVITLDKVTEFLDRTTYPARYYIECKYPEKDKPIKRRIFKKWGYPS